MNRRDFIVKSTLGSMALLHLSSLTRLSESLPETGALMPTLFIGHGSPMNAIEDNEFTRGWRNIAATLPAPKAIVCISAHWETRGTLVTAMKTPRTIHDFGGFPEELFKQQYPAPGSPELAEEIRLTVKSPAIGEDHAWGLDHGTWSVLLPMFPTAGIPVLQISLDYTQDPKFHYELGKQLLFLRKKGVLVVGSGNLVHNLRMLRWQDQAFDWATEMDHKITQALDAKNDEALIHYSRWGQEAKLAIPTPEHYLPLLYITALRQPNESLRYFNSRTTLGAISMRSFVVS